MKAIHSLIPPLTILIPLIGAFLVYLFGSQTELFNRAKWLRRFDLSAWQNLTVFASTLASFALSVLMLRYAISGYQLNFSMYFTLRKIFFRVDYLSSLFALFTSFIWMVASIYAVIYMKQKKHRTRFYAFWLLTLSANLGVVTAGDWLGLYIFFELLGLLAYVLIVHKQSKTAFAAGNKYLGMTIMGGIFLFFGIFLYYHYAGTLMFSLGDYSLISAGNIKYVIFALMVAGFGVKAGMMPLHTWLPDAHPVAPSPASALLSGVMIKAGAYGIMRVSLLTLHPTISGRAASSFGFAIIWIGITTMFIGIILALLQDNAKRMLAYSSISQMGYILMGLGTAAYLGSKGTFGLAGGVFHIVNHALFKSALFLGVGVVGYLTGELNMYKLGGLWRKMPAAFLFTLVAALAYGGIPPFNGFISKTLLHEAISQAFLLHKVLSLKAAEILFIVTSGASFCMAMKLIILIFFGKKSPKYHQIKKTPLLMNLSMLMLTILIILLGIYPRFLIAYLLAPSAKAIAGFSNISVYELVDKHLYTLGTLLPIAQSVIIGIAIFMLGSRFDLFHLKFPNWLGVDYLYILGARGGYQLLLAMGALPQEEKELIQVSVRKAKSFSISKALGRLIVGIGTSPQEEKELARTGAKKAKEFPLLEALGKRPLLRLFIVPELRLIANVGSGVRNQLRPKKLQDEGIELWKITTNLFYQLRDSLIRFVDNYRIDITLLVLVLLTYLIYFMVVFK